MIVCFTLCIQRRGLGLLTYVSVAVENLVVCLWQQGKHKECEQHLKRALAMKITAFGEDNIKLADSKFRACQLNHCSI